MKYTMILLSLLLSALSAAAQTSDTYPLDIDSIHVRDPYIYAESSTLTYYLYASLDTVIDGKERGGVVVYRSRDLKHWTLPQRVYTVRALADSSCCGAVSKTTATVSLKPSPLRAR